jgi:hypothetical protein
MTTWKLCMILMLPLMLERKRLRVWVAMMMGSLAAWMLPPLTANLDGLGPYILIDIAVGYVILAHPRLLPQLILGTLSIIMVTFSCGALAAKMLHGAANPDFYWRAMMLFSWARLFILASWGAADVARRCMPDAWFDRHSFATRSIG